MSGDPVIDCTTKLMIMMVFTFWASKVSATFPKLFPGFLGNVLDGLAQFHICSYFKTESTVVLLDSSLLLSFLC